MPKCMFEYHITKATEKSNESIFFCLHLILFVSLAFSAKQKQTKYKVATTSVILSPTYVWVSNKATSVQNQRVITYIGGYK